MKQAKRPRRKPKTSRDRLIWPLRLTRAGIAVERFVRCFWPMWSILLGALAALMFGIQDHLRTELVWGLAGIVGIGLLWTLIYGLRRFNWPDRAEAQARLDATLPGQPLATLDDTQAIGAGDAASRAVWKAHQERMAEAARNLRAVAPDLKVSDRDPYALRYAAVLAFAVALGFGSIWQVASVTQIVPGRGNAAATGPSWEGWVEPPAYTGLPSLYLNDLTGERIDVAEGSLITLRLYGQTGALAVTESVSGQPGTEPDSTAQQNFEAARSGEISIEGANGARWDIAVVGDTAPQVMLGAEMEITAAGEMRQEFSVLDDYGVVSGQAVMALDLDALDRRYGLATAPDARDAPELDLPLTISGDRGDFTETLTDNMSQHPWAGLPVKLTLEVVDAAGQTGATEPLSLPMPGRRFFDPTARAIIEMRRDLLWARANGRRVAQILRAISHQPDGAFERASPYLMLRTAIRRLEAGVKAGLNTEVQDEVAEALWAIAVQIEDGDIGDALERLRRAQERLQQAMRDGASQSEIEELMNELREATRDYMRQLAQNPQSTTDQPNSGDQQMLSQQDIQDMMDRIQELMEQGRMAEAEELMRQFQEMMENLQMTDQPGQGGQSEGQQAMEGLSDTLRQQQGLSDEAFRELQEQFNPGAQSGQSGENTGRSGGEGRGQSHEGQGGQGEGSEDGNDGREGGGGQAAGDGNPTSQDLANRQQALRDELSRQQQNLPGAGTAEGDAAREALDRAGRAMGEAEESLRQDDLAGALDNQADAMEALREGMRQLADQMARSQLNPGQQGQIDGQAGNRLRDPLGRRPGSQGPAGTEENLLQGEDVYRRARELLDELRKRSSDQERPDRELEYLKRLLDRF